MDDRQNLIPGYGYKDENNNENVVVLIPGYGYQQEEIPENPFGGLGLSPLLRRRRRQMT